MNDEVAVAQMHAQLLSQDEPLYPLERSPSSGSTSSFMNNSMTSDFWSSEPFGLQQQANIDSNNISSESLSDLMDLEQENQEQNAFKISSPYYSGSMKSLGQVNFMPVTVSPRDSILKSPQDDYYSRYDRMTSLFGPTNQGFDDGQQIFVHPSEIQNVEFLDNPEAMLEEEDEDEEDDDDSFDFDDTDMYSPDSDYWLPNVAIDGNEGHFSDPLFSHELPSLQQQEHLRPEPTQLLDHQSQSSQIDVKQSNEPDLVVSNIKNIKSDHSSPLSNPSQVLKDEKATVSPPSTLLTNRKDNIIVNSSSTATKPKRKVPSNAGPHRCELVNQQTGKTCGKVFSRPYDLIRHQDTIHAAVRKTFKCDLCGDASKTFSRMDALSRHIRIKHAKA